MIRFITCLRRRPELTLAQFREAWDSPDFDRLIQRTVEMIGAVHSVKSATLAVEANASVQLFRGTEEPYDGVLEYFLPSASFLRERAESPGFWDLQREMVACQERFADMGRSVAFFTESEQ